MMASEGTGTIGMRQRTENSFVQREAEENHREILGTFASARGEIFEKSEKAFEVRHCIGFSNEVN